MKKRKLILPFVLGFLALSMASCDNKSSGTTPQTPAETDPKTPTETGPTTPSALELVEVADADVESGDYIHGGEVFTIDKTNKKIKSITYENNDYKNYINKQGTTNYEANIKFVSYLNKNSIYFKYDNADYILYKNGTSYTLAKIKNSTTTSSSIYKMPEFPEVAYGNYVSSEQEHDKRDASGNRIPNGDGGYVKEKFYYHFSIRETEVKVYVSDNASTYTGDAIYSIQNYALAYNTGGLVIKIPKKEFNISISFLRNGTVRFTDSDGEGSIYSGSGNLTKVEK